MEALKREDEGLDEGYLILWEIYKESYLLHLLLFELISIYSYDF